MNWGNPVATGSLANDATEKEVPFAPTTGRFIDLRALTEVNGNPWTSMAEMNLLSPVSNSPVIPQTGWSLRYVDSQQLPNYAAVYAFDGNVNTFWHTQWSPSAPPPPHDIQIDLGQTYAIDGFRYLPRQDGSPNGRIGQYQFYVSMDGVNWAIRWLQGVWPMMRRKRRSFLRPRRVGLLI